MEWNFLHLLPLIFLSWDKRAEFATSREREEEKKLIYDSLIFLFSISFQSPRNGDDLSEPSSPKDVIRDVDDDDDEQEEVASNNNKDKRDPGSPGEEEEDPDEPGGGADKIRLKVMRVRARLHYVTKPCDVGHMIVWSLLIMG